VRGCTPEVDRGDRPISYPVGEKGTLYARVDPGDRGEEVTRRGGVRRRGDEEKRRRGVSS
jgi:hypothetical protein